jgi:hypothetical protein
LDASRAAFRGDRSLVFGLVAAAVLGQTERLRHSASTSAQIRSPDA